MAENRPTPTLYDVARHAGVSTATVSRCLNFPQQVSDKTREKVNAAIEELGYTPNFGARAMATQRTRTIGAIIPTMENAVFARGLQAFQEELDANGYNLLVASSSYQPGLEDRQIRALVARGADALLLIGHERDAAIYERLEAQQVPTLVTWAFDCGQSRPSIGFDNRVAMRDMAREVLKLGHRRIAIISAEIIANDRASARLDGVKDALAEAGVSAEDLQVITTPYGIENGAAAFRSLMSSKRRPTAVMCGNDVLAVGAVRQAHEMGIGVPDEVSISGFDDIELAQVCLPRLATVHVPHRDMGRRAAQVLISLLENGTEIASEELPTKLMLRGSLGPVPAGET